jgi:hypothetical protein
LQGRADDVTAIAYSSVKGRMAPWVGVGFVGRRMKSTRRSPDWVRARVRRVGITEWRPGGRGNVFEEPVLVCVNGTDYWREIYDQHGTLVASTDWPSTEGSLSRVQKLLRADGGTYFDIRGRVQLILARDYRHRVGLAHAIKATGPDGNEIGTIVIRGAKRGSIVAAGTTVGHLKPPPVVGLFGLGPNRGRYSVYDANKRAVGRITRRGTWTQCAVLEIDQAASESLRALMLAASAAVKHWLEGSGGG